MGSSLEYTPRIHASPRTCGARLGVIGQELVETGIQLFCNIHTHTAPIIYKSSSSSVQVCEAHPSLNICPVARPSSCLHLQPSVVIVIVIIIIITIIIIILSSSSITSIIIIIIFIFILNHYHQQNHYSPPSSSSLYLSYTIAFKTVNFQKNITMNFNLHEASVDKCGLLHAYFWEVAIAGVARQIYL